jgi:hypothetical protein
MASRRVVRHLAPMIARYEECRYLSGLRVCATLGNLNPCALTA